MTRLSISNIAWPYHRRCSFYSFLAANGCQGVEIAFTKIAPWAELSRKKIADEFQLIRSYNLEISSYQSLYYNLPDCQLLGSLSQFNLLLAQTVMIAEYSGELSSGGPGVFGAPLNRCRNSLDESEAFSLGAERLRIMAEAIAHTGFILALEAAPAHYKGDFLETTEACAEMVRCVDHRALRLHIDTGCLTLTGESGTHLVSKHHEIISHVHVSNPYLAPITRADCVRYVPMFRALSAVGYDGWISIEMREAPESFASVSEAIFAVLAACR